MKERGRRLRRREHHHERGGFRRMRHGDVRAALLLALVEGPAHGYELGQRLERASGGAWRPSPGSIYPTLQQLADEDAVIVTERDGKRIYELGKRGKSEVEDRKERGEENPWQAAADAPSSELKEALHALKAAVKQVASIGNADQIAKVTGLVVETRRQVYELLARS
ncbi:MAG: PadR family transcriptional regulator [Kofleriaceae bacterium]